MPKTETAVVGLTWRSLRDLESQYGDSIFILDREAFADNYSQFLSAFRSIYPNSNIAYSYKTNYTPQLCQYVRDMNGYAEVVSSMEYELALRVGVMPHRIIFNGPYKSQSDIEHALVAGSTVNLDSLHEVRVVEALSRTSPQQILNVGIRCNFDIGAGFISRFGFDVDADEFRTAFEILSPLKNCRLNGFHCHFSTGQRTIESYVWRARRLLELSNQYFGDHGPQFLNVGGGYFSQMSATLRAQFPFHVPTYEEYAEAVASHFSKAFRGGRTPELILEPGSALTANIMSFAAKIISIKKIRTRTVALASGSVHNIKPTLHDKNLPMHVIRSNQTSPRVDGPIDIVGYTCMEHDCLYRAYGGSLAQDDYVVFENVGAYTTVMKPPFIRGSPAIVGYDSASGAVEVIRRAETLRDVFATYSFDQR